MYLNYWGLDSLPFENIPDPNFFFGSTRHMEALARLKYTILAKRGAAMLTGDVGCGKTTVCGVLVEELKKENHRVAFIENPSLSPLELIQEILHHLGMKNPPGRKRELLQAFHAQLLDAVNKGQEMVVIIDESQVISPISIFEELRLLLNFRIDNRHSMTLILVGQPELRSIIKGLEQLQQRIAVRYHITPLNHDETQKYINYRLERAGVAEKLFSDGAMHLVYQYSKGIPRNINNCCDMSLLVSANKKLDSIDEKIVQKLIEELEGA